MLKTFRKGVRFLIVIALFLILFVLVVPLKSSGMTSQCEIMHNFVKKEENRILFTEWAIRMVKNKSFWADVPVPVGRVELFYLNKNVDFDWSKLDIRKQHAAIKMNFYNNLEANYHNYKIEDVLDIRLGTNRYQIIYEFNQLTKGKLHYKNIKVLCGNKISTVIGENKGEINIIDVGD